jgi:uncharacterized RDD family membrane protein YckC
VTQPPPQPGGPFPGPPPGPGYGPTPPGYPVYGPPPGYSAYGPPPGHPGFGPPPGHPAYGRPPYGYPPLPPLSPGGQPLADFGSRLLAAMIDGAILGVVGLILGIPLFVYLFSQLSKMTDSVDPVTGELDSARFFGGFGSHILLLELGFTVVLLVIYYVYYVEMLHKSGQSVGKRVMKLRIVPIDPTARLTRGMVALRYLVEFVAAMFVPFLPYLDGLWQLWDKPYQQTLHDKAARTVVIKVSP